MLQSLEKWEIGLLTTIHIQSTLALWTPRYYAHLAVNWQELNPRPKLQRNTVKTLAIADSRYYGIADTSRGPKIRFFSFYFRYSGHLGRQY